MNRFDEIKKDLSGLETELTDLAEFLYDSKNNDELTLKEAKDVIRQYKPEFKEGQQVTFKPYEVALPAIVRGVSFIYDRYIYELRSTSNHKDRPVYSVTSGCSILESELFKPYNAETFWKE